MTNDRLVYIKIEQWKFGKMYTVLSLVICIVWRHFLLDTISCFLFFEMYLVSRLGKESKERLTRFLVTHRKTHRHAATLILWYLSVFCIRRSEPNTIKAKTLISNYFIGQPLDNTIGKLISRTINCIKKIRCNIIST